jgi:hypothetical protein
MSFYGIVSGEHPLMSCPFSGPWLQVINDIHYPIFYGAIALDKTIILHDLNLITLDIKWKEKDKTIEIKDIKIKKNCTKTCKSDWTRGRAARKRRVRSGSKWGISFTSIRAPS